jgi:hypothetical protein
MEATRSSETSVNNKATRRHIPEDGILHSHRRENLKSYTSFRVSAICECHTLDTADSIALIHWDIALLMARCWFLCFVTVNQTNYFERYNICMF